MRISTRPLVFCATVFAAASVVGAPIARAQCTITGPSQVCPGDSIELCGPVLDNVTYLWQGPDDLVYQTDCILVFDPGLYTLTIRNNVTRAWSEPCSLVVQSGRAAAPEIAGPPATCGVASVQWCGPAGNLEYDWSGPNGFSQSTACVSVSEPGDYSLRVRSLPGGCWGDSTVRSLGATTCLPAASNCPRPAWWWMHQCRERDHGRLDRSQLAAVAGCVDERSVALSWNDDAAGFVRTLKHERRTLRMRARRQFATVWANVCAGELGLVPRGGSAVALDPATSMDASLGGGTIASWLAFADGELVRLEGMSERSRSVKDAYRRLIRTGWHLNHGQGIGVTCQSDLREDMRVALEEESMESESELESLASEMVDEGDGPLALGAPEPNPFNSQTSFAFAVSTTAPAPVSIAIYDVSGRLVRELVDGAHAPGQYVVRWDGSAADGTRVKSGLYFIRGRIGEQQVQSRVTLIR